MNATQVAQMQAMLGPIAVPNIAVPTTPAAKKLAPSSKDGAKKKDKKEPSARKVNPLPAALEAFQHEHKDCLSIVEKEDPDPKIDVPVRVAISITTGRKSKNPIVWTLNDLKLDQLRKLASSFGTKGGGSASKYDCCRAVALKHDMGKQCDCMDGQHPHTTPHDRKVNAMLQIINAAFLPEFTRLQTFNDVKKRKNFEGSTKRNPDNEFWGEVFDVVNDPEQNERVGTLCDATEDGDVRVFGWVMEAIINLNDFSPGSFKTCCGHMRDLMLARQAMLRSKKTSGKHSDDTWNYCNRKHLMIRKGIVMPEIPVYCLDLMCRMYPDIDAACAVALEENLVSTSTQEPEVNAAKSGQKDKFLKVFEAANNSVSKSQKEASGQRQKLIDLQEKKDMSTTQLQTVIEMSDAPNKQHILRNLAVGVKSLETSLSIDPSSSCLNGVSNLDW